MRRYFAAVVVIAFCSTPLRAELKVTGKMVARQVAGAPAGNDVMAAMVGPMISQMYGGAEGVEMTLTINEDGRVRIDYPAAFQGRPAGAAVIQRTDGTSVGFDVKTQTWWKMVDPMADPGTAAMLAQLKPELTTKPTGEFVSVAGLKAERVSLMLQTAMKLPPSAAQLPPELLAMIPKEIRVDGDAWVASGHAKYTKGMIKVLAQGPLAGVGLDKLLNGLQGPSVRLVIRVSVLAGWELETLMSKVVEEDVPDSVFDVPAGFKEIPMPTGSGKLPAV